MIYTIVGSSMLPFLRERRDIVEIRKKGTSRCKRYDVVLYKREGEYILHRILSVQQEGYVIAGDHNTFREMDIKDENILGVMTRVIRDGKSIYSTDWKYRLYVHLWYVFFYIRLAIMFAKRLMISSLRRVKQHVKPEERRMDK